MNYIQGIDVKSLLCENFQGDGSKESAGGTKNSIYIQTEAGSTEIQSFFVGYLSHPSLLL